MLRCNDCGQPLDNTLRTCSETGRVCDDYAPVERYLWQMWDELARAVARGGVRFHWTNDLRL